MLLLVRKLEKRSNLKKWISIETDSGLKELHKKRYDDWSIVIPN